MTPKQDELRLAQEKLTKGFLAVRAKLEALEPKMKAAKSAIESLVREID